MSKDIDYLGDGVYSIFDGHGVWLHANDHENPTDRVYLEPQVIDRLIEFICKNYNIESNSLFGRK